MEKKTNKAQWIGEPYVRGGNNSHSVMVVVKVWRPKQSEG